MNTIIFPQKDNRPPSRWALVLLAAALLVWGVLSCQTGQKDSVFSRKVGAPPPSGQPPEGFIVARSIPDTTNVHFDSRYCLECHEKLPIAKTELYLKYNGNTQYLCSCHYNSGKMHPHPVDYQPSGEVKIAAGFPLKDEKLTCITCHDVVRQCQDSPSEKILRQGILRGAPYNNPIDICFRCHDKNQYAKYNPHEQLDATGEIVRQKCLYCHSEVPDAQKTGIEDVKLIGNYGAICMGCHNSAAKQPLHQRHLRKPSDEVLAQINQMQTRFNIVLPLDQEGRVTCVTCHNPHQKGLIPDKRAGAAGAGELHRHRLSGNMCLRCHPMRDL